MPSFRWSRVGRIPEDIRYGWRRLLAQPLLSAAVAVTLALGIGLDVGVFTVVDGLLFRARVSSEPQTFVQIDARPLKDGAVPRGGLPMVSRADFLAYRDHASSLKSVAAWTPVHATLRDVATPASQDVIPILVTCNFFSVYPARPILGRAFTERDCAAPGRDPVVLLGEQFWRRRYGARPEIVGSRISLNERSLTVVGVLPDGYDGQLRGPLWIPYSMNAAFFGGQELFESPKPWLVMVGRLQPGVARETAAAEMAVIARQRDRLVPGRETRLRLTNGSTIDLLPTSTSAMSLVSLVMGGLSLVLFIACANVSTLLLSRATARHGEMGVRLSLGATPGRLVRMLLIENVLLVLIAAPLGAWVAWQVPVIWRSQMPDLPHYAFGFDLKTLLYLVATSLAVGGLIAIVPIVEALRGQSVAAASERTGSARRSRTGARLIVAQVAMSVVVAVGAVLLIRGERALRSAPPGFETERVLLATPRIASPPYTASMTRDFYRRLSDRVHALPGVRSVSFASTPPLGSGEADVEGLRLRAREPSGREVTITENLVSADYFATLGIPIVRGRALRDDEAASEPRPVVISDALARTLLAGRDPIGQELTAGTNRLFAVVGVAGDVSSLAGDGPGRFSVYGSRTGAVAGDVMMVLFDGDAAAIAGAIRGELRTLDPNTVVEPRTLGVLRRELADRLLRMVRIVTVLGLAAVALAGIGLYGIASFSADHRTKEMGIRIALGATRANVVGQALRSGFRPVAAGLCLGMAIAAWAARVLQLSLQRVNIEAQSPTPYVAAASLLASIALIAMFGPAVRAGRTDPVVALRRE